MVLLVASSSIDLGIGCWHLHTGAEQLRYKSCASPAHGLVCVGERFLACSQLRDPAATSGSVLYWSWFKPQVEVKSFPAEPIMALASNNESTYLVGGGFSGDIYLWEVWSLSKGKLLRNIKFPSIIDAIALDPDEHVFYGGGRDGKIYTAALNAKSPSSSDYGLHILGSLSNQSKSVTSLAYCSSGNLLISGSEDGAIRVWDTRTRTNNIIRVLKHSKGPVNNILIVRLQLLPKSQLNSTSQGSLRKHRSLLPPALAKFENSKDEDEDTGVIIGLSGPPAESMGFFPLSSQVMDNQITELQQQGSAATGMELERLKCDYGKSMQMLQHWRKMSKNCQIFAHSSKKKRNKNEPSAGKNVDCRVLFEEVRY